MYMVGMESENAVASDCSDAQLLMESMDSLSRNVNSISSNSPMTNEIPSSRREHSNDLDPYSDETTNLILSLRMPRVFFLRILDRIEGDDSRII